MRVAFSKIAFACLLVSAACFASPGEADPFLSDEELFGEAIDGASTVRDPFETINRVIFRINDLIYVNFLDPLAAGYSMIVPDPVEKGAGNFFRNLKYPVRLVGNLLQGEFAGAWVETGRFLINSTVGFAGIATPSDKVEGFRPIPSEDIGRALAALGMGEGPYLVLPLLGPSNLRDLIGLIGDRLADPFVDPFSVWDEWEEHFIYGGTQFTVDSPAVINSYMAVRESAIDPYTAIKNAYTDRRRTTDEIP